MAEKRTEFLWGCLIFGILKEAYESSEENAEQFKLDWLSAPTVIEAEQNIRDRYKESEFIINYVAIFSPIGLGNMITKLSKSFMEVKEQYEKHQYKQGKVEVEKAKAM